MTTTHAIIAFVFGFLIGGFFEFRMMMRGGFPIDYLRACRVKVAMFVIIAFVLQMFSYELGTWMKMYFSGVMLEMIIVNIPLAIRAQRLVDEWLETHGE